MKEKKKIISIGFDFPGDDVEYASFLSNKSLTDADIIVCKPCIERCDEAFRDSKFSNVHSLLEYYQKHWLEEFREATTHSKTIFLYLDAPKKISNWGVSPYEFIPFVN